MCCTPISSISSSHELRGQHLCSAFDFFGGDALCSRTQRRDFILKSKCSTFISFFFLFSLSNRLTAKGFKELPRENRSDSSSCLAKQTRKESRERVKRTGLPGRETKIKRGGGIDGKSVREREGRLCLSQRSVTKGLQLTHFDCQAERMLNPGRERRRERKQVQTGRTRGKQTVKNGCEGAARGCPPFGWDLKPPRWAGGWWGE